MMAVQYLSPSQDAVVPMLTKRQIFYRKHRNMVGSCADRMPLKAYGEDHSMLEPIVFRWHSENTDDETFCLSENADLSELIACSTEGHSASVLNLKPDTAYYWRVGNGDVQCFRTDAMLPRLLSVDGITNVRDLGGYRTADGRNIRMNMLFRGSELDHEICVTDTGIDTMRNILGVRTELDLRYPEVVGDRCESVLGKDIGYITISIRAYCDLFRYRAEIFRIFSLLCEEERYPIYFHCYGGADRTGMLALLILSVLGVAEEDIRLDYEMTTCSIFGYRSYETAYMAEFLDRLNRFPGETFGERAIAYLRSCGCTDGMFEKIRTILLYRDTL